MSPEISKIGLLRLNFLAFDCNETWKEHVLEHVCVHEIEFLFQVFSVFVGSPPPLFFFFFLKQLPN